MTREQDSAVYRLSSKEALILDMLINGSRGSMCGLQLVTESGGLLKRGTVYVTLDRMEDRGLIASVKEPKPEGSRTLRRRYYWATVIGRRALQKKENS